MSSSNQAVSVKTPSPLINTAQPRPHANTIPRQLPSLPIPIKQLTAMDNSDLTEPYFDTNNTENEDELSSERFAHSSELYYYQTSSSSSSSKINNSSSAASSDNEHNEEQSHDNQEDNDDDDDDDDEVLRINQRLRNDDDDDDYQTSSNEYEG